MVRFSAGRPASRGLSLAHLMTAASQTQILLSVLPGDRASAEEVGELAALHARSSRPSGSGPATF
jgi:hypothetical protein